MLCRPIGCNRVSWEVQGHKNRVAYEVMEEGHQETWNAGLLLKDSESYGRVFS